MKSQEIKALLCKRFAPPEYAFFTEVAASTGFAGSYADGLAFHLWPSSGHPIYGFEIKISRNDWLRELKQPAKPVVMQYCDKWWLVAPKGVAVLEEIPKAWGFMEIVNGKIYTRKQAPDLEAIEPPLGFIAALLRRATEKSIPRETLHEQVMQAKEEYKAYYAKEIEEAKNKLKEYEAKVREWEEASGLKVFAAGWGPSSKELGMVVRWVLEGNLKRTLEYNTENAVKGLREVLSRLEHFQKMSKDFPELPQEIRALAHHY